MLYARLTSGDWVIGVTDENIARLTKGEDMMINLQQFDKAIPLVLMIHAKDMDGLKAKIEKASGAPLPPETPMSRH
jgi:hypothetical protein